MHDPSRVNREHEEILTDLIMHLDMQKYTPGAYLLAVAKFVGAVAAMSTEGEKSLDAVQIVARESYRAIKEKLPTLSKLRSEDLPRHISPGSDKVH